MNESSNSIDGGVNLLLLIAFFFEQQIIYVEHQRWAKCFAKCYQSVLDPLLVRGLLQINKLCGYPDFPPDDSSAMLAVT